MRKFAKARTMGEDRLEYWSENMKRIQSDGGHWTANATSFNFCVMWSLNYLGTPLARESVLVQASSEVAKTCLDHEHFVHTILSNTILSV